MVDTKFIKTGTQALIDAEALELRNTGMTFKAIGEQMGCSAPGAFQRCQRALAMIAAPAVEEHRRIELAKLDLLELKAIEVLDRKHVYVSQGGKIIYDGPEKLEDDAPTLAAINSMLKIQERRSRLLGLDAPVRQQIEVTTYEGGGEIERELSRLAVLLASSEGGGGSLPLGEQTGEAQAITS